MNLVVRTWLFSILLFSLFWSSITVWQTIAKLTGLKQQFIISQCSWFDQSHVVVFLEMPRPVAIRRQLALWSPKSLTELATEDSLLLLHMTVTLARTSGIVGGLTGSLSFSLSFFLFPSLASHLMSFNSWQHEADFSKINISRVGLKLYDLRVSLGSYRVPPLLPSTDQIKTGTNHICAEEMHKEITGRYGFWVAIFED